MGAVNQDRVLKSLSSLEQKWAAKEVEMPNYTIPEQSDDAKLFFVDIPGAKQSVLNLGYLALARTDPDYYKAVIMNYKLGGNFNSNVNLVLREEKGFTYGARSGFSGTDIAGPFTASSSVRTNTTFESVKIFKEEMENYREGISEEDLEFTKNAMIKSNARRFETLGSLLGMLSTRGAYDLPADYIANEEAIVRSMTLEEHKEIAQKYIHPDKMVYLVTGDGATQFEQFKGVGFDQVQLLGKDGKPVNIPIIIEVDK